MSSRAAIVATSVVLDHVPDLVRYGSKPRRETARWFEIDTSLRTYEDAVTYPPNQVVIGNLRPEDLWDRERPWWKQPVVDASDEGMFGDIGSQADFYAALADEDQFDLIHSDGAVPDGALPLHDGDREIGWIRADHEDDPSLAADVLLENLAIKASGVRALRDLLRRTAIDPGTITHAIGCGEACDLTGASAIDVKSFCAAPVHALVVAAALIEAGIEHRVVVVAGGSLAKLGMKFAGALRHDVPVLEDVLAGLAILVGRPQDGAPIIRLDAVGRHRIGSGSAQQAVLEDLVVEPLARLGRGILDIERYATELHDPEITEPAGAGNVPLRNYKLIGALAVKRGELDRQKLDDFERERGLPGFSPTQGHVASAVPWLPHGLGALRRQEIGSTMLVAKGSLFLGRMTELADGMSILLEPGKE